MGRSRSIPFESGAGAAADADSNLRALARLAREAGRADIADDADALAQRVTEGRFYLACVGQFKRGKSTLLNALIGDAILPAGVVPVTSVVTIIRHGDRRGARLRLAGGVGWQDIDPANLATFVSEEHNPQNAKGVAAVEVLVPSGLLATGMCLVDTPGIGSVFAGNTEAVRAFVPHIDAALVVLGAEPPISGDELALVEDVSRQAGDLIFVLNKADRLTEVERPEVIVFSERVLAERLGRPIGRILEVSALEKLSGAGPDRDWAALERALENLARGSGSDLVRAAEDRGLAVLAGRLHHDLDERREALLRPVAASERRITELRRSAAEIERSLNDLGHLQAAEAERIVARLAERRERFLAVALPAARGELHASLRAAVERRGSALRRRAVVLAQEIAERWLERWRAEVGPAAEESYREASRRFVELANGFLERLAAAGEADPAGLPAALGPELGFRARSRLYYTKMLPLTSRSAAAWLLDQVRPRDRALCAIARDGAAYIERLLVTNSSRVEGDLAERLLESRRRLEAEVRSLLRGVSVSAERALDCARSKQEAGAGAVEAEIGRLAALAAEVEQWRS